MRRRVLGALAVASVLGQALLFTGTGEADGINWHESYQDGLAAARTSGRPIFLEFR